jgi:hypothetical protein
MRYDMNRAVRTLVTILAVSVAACAEYAHRIVNLLDGALVTESIREVL